MNESVENYPKMNINKPNPFTPNKNQIARDWQIWREEFFVFLKLSNGYAQFSKEQRALLLINFMGTEAIKAMEKISFENANDKKDMDILLMKFDDFFNPALNEVEERYKFFSRRKSPNEDLEKYILDLKEKATKCNFGNQSEKFIIDMLILSMDEHLRDLIWASNLATLPDIMYNYKQYNIDQDKMKELSETANKNLNTENFITAESYTDQQPRQNPSARRGCSKCGMKHPYKQCLAFDKICQNCFLRGHYTSMCKSGLRNNPTNVFDEESKPSTSKVKQSQGTKVDTMEHCPWCNSEHIPGKCRHDAGCKRCDDFPHLICFECKKNPHEHNCYYKNILTLPVIKMVGDTQPNQIKKPCKTCGCIHENHIPCKYCGSCLAYGHWINECPRKNNQFQFNNRAQPTVQNLLDGFVEIGNAFTTPTQPPRQAPVNHGPRQRNQNYHRQNTRPSNNRNKNEKSDACSIS